MLCSLAGTGQPVIHGVQIALVCQSSTFEIHNARVTQLDSASLQRSAWSQTKVVLCSSSVSVMEVRFGEMSGVTRGHVSVLRTGGNKELYVFIMHSQALDSALEQ